MEVDRLENEVQNLKERLAKCREFIQLLEQRDNRNIHRNLNYTISDIVQVWDEFKLAKKACEL